MSKLKACLECGTFWETGETCEDHFHQMLYWEAENPSYGQVHHLAVLSYYLQHPSLYSPAGLIAAKQLLTEFLVEKIPPQITRRRMLAKLDDSGRKTKIKGTKDMKGSYKEPILWSVTAKDVVAGGATKYCENVRKWSQTIFETLKATGNF
jgi:hypothetical protein